MKKILTLIFFLSAMLSGQKAWAFEYDLWVGGVRVTDDNMFDIRPAGLTRGRIVFYGGTLTFDNVTLEPPSQNVSCITNKMDALAVQFIGENDLTSQGKTSTIISYKPMAIGGGSWNNPATAIITCVTSYNLNYSCIEMVNAESLDISNLYLHTRSYSKYGITGNNTTLYTSCAEIHAVGAEKAIHGFSAWNMLDYGILDDNCYYSTAEQCALKSDGTEARLCVLRNGLYIGKSMPRIGTSQIKLNPVGTTGNITMVGSEKKLILDGVQYNDSLPFIINNNVSNLVIETTSNPTVAETLNGTVIRVKANTKFVGDAALTTKGQVGLYAEGNAKIELNIGSEAFFEGSSFGYLGGHKEGIYENSDLILTKANNSSDYYFKGGFGSLIACSHLQLNGMDFFYSNSYGTPGCYFDEETHNVVKTGGKVVGGTAINFFGIAREYPVFVLGKQLNNCNCAGGFGSPYLKTGKLIYDPDELELTLDSLTIDNTSDTGTNDGIIRVAEDQDIRIKVRNENNLVNKYGYAGLWLSRKTNVTIEGSGELTVSGRQDDLYVMTGSNLALRGKVTVEAPNRGINSNNFPDSLIVAESATLKAKMVSGFGTLSLEDGHVIAAPSGAVFSPEERAIMLDGAVARDVVITKIEPYYLDVCDVPVTNVNCNDILGDGVFSFDRSDNTLYVQNANINDPSIGNVVNYYGTDSLNVVFSGDNRFVVSDNILVLEKSAGIRNSGTVYGELLSPDGYGIWFKDNIFINIINGNFTIKGQRAISGKGEPDVRIESGKFSFISTDKENCGLKNMKSLSLGKDMFFSKPTGCYFEPKLKGISVDSTSLYCGDFTIEADETFDLAILGTKVTKRYSQNCGSDHFHYDYERKTLTIDGDFTYAGSAPYNIIESGINGLTIKVTSPSVIKSGSNASIIKLNGSTTITGELLKLDTNCQDNDGNAIFCKKGTLMFDWANVIIPGDGFESAISGSSDADLVIRYSDIRATAHDYGVISNWRSIELEGCYLSNPDYKVSDNGICDEQGYLVGGNFAPETVIISLDADAVRAADADAAAPAEVFDLSGRKLDQPVRGINIIRRKDGSTMKALQK